MHVQAVYVIVIRNHFLLVLFQVQVPPMHTVGMRSPAWHHLPPKQPVVYSTIITRLTDPPTEPSTEPSTEPLSTSVPTVEPPSKVVGVRVTLSVLNNRWHCLHGWMNVSQTLLADCWIFLDMH